MRKKDFIDNLRLGSVEKPADSFKGNLSFSECGSVDSGRLSYVPTPTRHASQMKVFDNDP